MHVYVYDSFVNQKKYNKILANIETRITDLGLNGKISRLGIMKNIHDIVNNELRGGAKTIVAVGNDKTINQIINSLAGSQVPLGIIPVGEKNNQIAASLGIDLEEEACDVLSARRIAELNLGQANNIYFLANAKIINMGTTIEINKNYAIEIMKQGEVRIINLTTADTALLTKKKSNPQDGVLELFIKTKESKNFLKNIVGQSVFSLKKLAIFNKHYPVILDNAVKIPAPVEISIAKQKLNIIVGKKRTF